MAEPSASESSAATDSDQDFDPTAEMLVNDFDDEHTLDEEEALEGDANGSNEIDDLQKESEMPLEELLAMYGYSEKINQISDNKNLDKIAIEKAEATSTTNSAEAHSSTDPSSNASHHQTQSQQSVVQHLRSHIAFTHMNSHNLVSDSSDGESEEDELSINEEDWRRTIQVGSEYQASVPEGLCIYDDAPAYENEDRLLWDPIHLDDDQIEDYLIRFKQKTEEDDMTSPLPEGAHVRDDEQALFLLHQCGHNIEEALRRRRTTANLPVIYESMTPWSEDECKAFEAGLRIYGKDFHAIQLNKIRTRSVGELVQFYYLWKKTERHDVFATKCRLEKKKYTLHPGTTDYMDRFLDEQENLALSSLNNIQSSNRQLHLYRSSPNVISSPLNKDILMDDLTAYSNLQTFCDSGGGGSPGGPVAGHVEPQTDAEGIISNMNTVVPGVVHGAGFVNGLIKNASSDNNNMFLGAGISSGGNSLLVNSNQDKVCHPSMPNDWSISSGHSNSSSHLITHTATSTNTLNGPDSVSNSESSTITSNTRKSVASISSSTDSNIHHSSLANATNTNA